MTVDENNKEKVQGYSCSLTLHFNPIKHGKINDFIANGFGKNKRLAR